MNYKEHYHRTIEQDIKTESPLFQERNGNYN